MTAPTIPEGPELPALPSALAECKKLTSDHYLTPSKYEFVAGLLLDYGRACMIAAAPTIPLPAAPVQGWVSVKDRLPEDDCAVLVASWRYITGEQKVESGHYSQGLCRFDKNDVTHWMPLPPPPVGEN